MQANTADMIGLISPKYKPTCFVQCGSLETLADLGRRLSSWCEKLVEFQFKFALYKLLMINIKKCANVNISHSVLITQSVLWTRL